MKNFISKLTIISFILFISCQNSENSGTDVKKDILNSTKIFHYGSVEFSYPKGWFIYVDTLQGLQMNIFKKSETDSTMFDFDISLSATPKYYKEQKISFDEYSNNQIEKLKEQNSLTIIKEEKTALNSRRVNHYEAQYPTDAGVHETANLYFIEGSYEDIFIFATGNKKFQSPAQSIIQSIKVK